MKILQQCFPLNLNETAQIWECAFGLFYFVLKGCSISEAT